MIYEESCDTEDWSNDAENAAMQSYIFFLLLYAALSIPTFEL